MFHPARLALVHTDQRPWAYGSFVGVREGEGGIATFVMPPGFDDFPASDDTAVSRAFFSLYRALREFRRVQAYNRSAEQDGARESKGGFRIEVKDEEPATLYSKIPMLEAVLDQYDELQISTVIHRNRRTERIDYGQLHRYLHDAVYLEDHTAFVDEMVLPRPILTLDVTALVQLFCFIYGEVKRALGETLAPEVSAHASAFKLVHLSPDSYLFEGVESHERTIGMLKEKLYEIDRQTRYKDHDYWHFYDAVEVFLFGNLNSGGDGVYWGITSFAPVWEDMCLVWLRENFWDGVIFADAPRYANQTIGGHRVYVGDSFVPPFYFELKGYRRFLRPDIVRYTHSEGRWSYLDELFDVSELPQGKGVRIRLTQDDDKAGNWFVALKKQLLRQRPGFRQPAGRSGGRFLGVRKADVATAISVMSRGSKQEDVWRVTDFKCVPLRLYTAAALGRKATADVLKQVCYEYALQIYVSDVGDAAATNSQLCVPRYFRSPPREGGRIVVGVSCERELLHKDLQEQDIDVFQVDLFQVLASYLRASEEQVS